MAVYYNLKQRMGLCLFFLAVGSYLSFYPALLFIPLAISFIFRKNISGFYFCTFQFIKYFMVYLLIISLLLYVTVLYLTYNESSVVETNDYYELLTKYIFSTFGPILRIEDLTPNVGLNWYFLTEMFNEFRSFFVIIFHLQLVSWVIPITIKFKEDPIFCYFLIIATISVFKSYPSLGDTALWMGCFLPLQQKTFKYMRNPFVAINMVFYSFILLPFFHYIWIYRGSGNSNFFYAISLVWSTGQVLLITDVVYGWLRRDFDIKIYSSNDEKEKLLRNVVLILK